jgi:hypothetical protein
MDAKRTLCIPKKSVIRDLKSRDGVVPVERVELPTFGLQNRCSTAELNRREVRGLAPSMRKPPKALSGQTEPLF